MATHNHALGARGEAMAARWYEARGYEVLARNWRCRAGELDVVLRINRTVVFCEVKTRSNAAFGMPEEAVTRAKQIRIRRLAAIFLGESKLRARDIRFDVVAIVGDEILVIEDAF